MKYSLTMRIITYFLYCFTGGPLLSTRLYAPQQKASFLDFSADENGLWTIMGMIKTYRYKSR